MLQPHAHRDLVHQPHPASACRSCWPGWRRRGRTRSPCRLKWTEAAFPREALASAGYGSLVCGQKAWNGVALLAHGAAPPEVCRGLARRLKRHPIRYLEDAIGGVLVASLYTPNGNPCPRPKFDYKLAWLQRLDRHAAQLLAANRSVVLTGDFNVVPTEHDFYSPKTWLDNG